MWIMGGYAWANCRYAKMSRPEPTTRASMLPFDDPQEVSVSLNGGATGVPDGAVAAATALCDGTLQSLIITNVGGKLTAFYNICPHAGRRLDWAPGQFLVDQGRLVCAAHGAAFERATGVCVSGPCKGAALARLTLPWRLKSAG